MFKISFNKPACQNIRESLRKEWLETNGLGSYASSTIPCCNTRKYHGLLVANLENPDGRYVLLSALEESLRGEGKEFFISCRKHPEVYYPRGHEYLQEMNTTPWPSFRYRIGDLRLTREVLMPHKKNMTIVRYTLSGEATAANRPLVLAVKPLLAFRHFHTLTFENQVINSHSRKDGKNAFSIQPYPDLPSLYMKGSAGSWVEMPDWYRKAEYIVEEERGFPFSEDLFKPGLFEIPISMDTPVYVAASLEPVEEPLEAIWEAEARRRAASEKTALAAAPGKSGLLAHLSERAEDFLITTPYGKPSLLAGYHWFDAWGRDTCIALPGLTVFAGNIEEGLRQLEAIGSYGKNGLIPNCIAADGINHAHNSVDASLWYVWAVQQFDMHASCPDLIRDACWPVIKSIIEVFLSGPMPTVFVDAEGLVHAGDENTQLTWMDAQVRGKPVTPRHGCPVEINALWYNALAYAASLSERFGEPDTYSAMLPALKKAFDERFWVQDGYLADVWREDGRDESIRPNQIFAVSLPFPVLDESKHMQVFTIVRKNLLTPYGLRTLSPDSPDYRSIYFGKPESRDGAYHQGTVWPWLLGAFGDAMFTTIANREEAVSGLLDYLTPLFAVHLARAGLGSISEVFDASPPHYPNGCIAQAWSVAEPLRLLHMLYKASPGAFTAWEIQFFANSQIQEHSVIKKRKP